MDEENVKVEQPEVTSQENASISPENEINWQKFREQRSEERKVRAELEAKAKRDAEEKQALKEALEALVNNKTNYSEEPAEVSSDEEWDRRFQQWEQKQERKKAEEEQRNAPALIRQEYHDFDKICSDENIDYLQYKFPEVYVAFKAMPDSRDKWRNIYGAIKRLIPNPDSSKDQRKAEKNFNKPQSMNVGGVTSTGDSAPMMLTESRKADNYKRMVARMKGTA